MSEIKLLLLVAFATFAGNILFHICDAALKEYERKAEVKKWLEKAQKPRSRKNRITPDVTFVEMDSTTKFKPDNSDPMPDRRNRGKWTAKHN